MDLEYKMKGSLKSSKPQVVRVEFDPTLLGYEEVKPRLLSMKVDADEALGTVRSKIHIPRLFLTNVVIIYHTVQVKSPQITHFELPFQIWITTSLLLLLTYASLAPSDSDSNPNHHHAKFWWLAHVLCPGIFPTWFIPLSWGFTIIAHAGEGLYATSLAYKHHMPWHIAVSFFFTPFHTQSRASHKTAMLCAVMSFNCAFACLAVPCCACSRHYIY
jgi:hypothetical protein